MINLLIGPPGGGKSYEAVVFHILPALQAGRKVITNLPLDLERLRAIDPAFPALVQFVENRRGVLPVDGRTKALLARFTSKQAEPEEGIIRAFQTMADYCDSWRHPENGAGPLYVIDECHLAMPRGNTLIEVEEWFSLHRHELADVLLITQSYGKVSKSIIDLVQVCYRVKKGTAFGTSTRYIRKVQDGVRGDVVNTSIRKYEKRYFGLYKSHTRTSGAGQELGAEDITPIWKRWPFIGAGVMIPLAVVLFISSGSPNILKPKAAQAAVSNPVPAVAAISPGQPPAEVEVKDPEPEGHPFGGRTLHIVGSAVMRQETRYYFAVAQNGQKVSEVDSRELEGLGYKVKPGATCAVQVAYKKWSNWIICDAPQQAVMNPGGDMQPGSRKAAEGVAAPAISHPGKPA